MDVLNTTYKTFNSSQFFCRSKLGTSSDANDSQTLISSNSLSTDSDSSLTSAHGLEKSSSKFILSQSKKPSGATKSNDQEDIEDTNNSANDFESKSALELKVQVKDMKIELERRETELKDLQVRLTLTLSSYCTILF